MFPKWDSSVWVHVCFPPFAVLLYTLSPETLTTCPMVSPLSVFLPQPLEKLLSSCIKKRASDHDRANQLVHTGSWARREQHTRRVRLRNKVLTQKQPRNVYIGWAWPPSPMLDAVLESGTKQQHNGWKRKITNPTN